MNKIQIAGIDAALRNFGLAVATYDIDTGDFEVTRVGIIQTEKGSVKKVIRVSSDDLRCAQELVRGTRRFLKDNAITIAMAEIPSGGQSARAAYSFGMATGVLASVDVPMVEVTPSEVKMASVGKKTASKEEIIQWAVGKWPHAGWLTRKSKGEIVLMNDNEHLADACAVLAAGVQTSAFLQAISMFAATRRAA